MDQPDVLVVTACVAAFVRLPLRKDRHEAYIQQRHKSFAP